MPQSEPLVTMAPMMIVLLVDLTIICNLVQPAADQHVPLRHTLMTQRTRVKTECLSASLEMRVPTQIDYFEPLTITSNLRVSVIESPHVPSIITQKLLTKHAIPVFPPERLAQGQENPSVSHATMVGTCSQIQSPDCQPAQITTIR